MWRIVKGIVVRIIVHFGRRRILIGIIYGNVGPPFGVEINGGNIIKQAHRLANRSRKDLPHGLFVLEFYLRLRGMYVHINVFGVHFKIDEVRHLFALRRQSFEGLHHGLVEIRVFHVATVHKEILVCTFLACRFGLTHKAMYLTNRRFYVEREQVLTDAFAENVYYTLFKNHRRQVEHLGSVAAKRKGDVGIYKGYALEGGDDVVEFCGIGFEKLAPGRDVIKEIFDNEVAPHGACARLLSGEL